MSYEGYDQVLCKNGHYFTFDCYSAPDYFGQDGDPWVCTKCGEKAVWWNGVDETNGIYCSEFILKAGICNKTAQAVCGKTQVRKCQALGGRIDGRIDLEVDKPAEYSTCKHCGCTKEVSAPTYKIPTDGRGHHIADLTKQR